MTIALATEHLTPAAIGEVRAACAELALELIEWQPGQLQAVPRVVIAGLASGARRIPAGLIALLEASSTVRLILCAQEPLVRPRYAVGDGRICLLSPPAERAEIAAALAVHLGPGRDAEPAGVGRFQTLRRTHWLAWSQGSDGAAVSIHENRGTTLVVGRLSGDEREALAGAITTTAPDEWIAPPRVGIAHLREEATEWILSWPVAMGALWMCSSRRVPMRWNAALSGERQLLRLPAFPSDQLVGVWSTRPLLNDPLAERGALVLDSGVDTFANLDKIACDHAGVTGLVVEVR